VIHIQIATEDMDLSFWQYSIPAEQKNTVFRIQPDGIFSVKKTDDGMVEKPLWKWSDFEITEIIEIKHGTELEYQYGGSYNGNVFSRMPLERLKNMIAPESLLYSKYKQIFGPLVQAYIKGEHIPIYETDIVLGFTKSGWRMPDKCRIDAMPNSIKAKIIQQMEYTFKSTPYSKEQVCKWVFDTYMCMTLNNKDIIFAYACIQPFLYCLRDYTKLLFLIALGSPEGETGKSTGLASLLTKWWNNCKGKEVLTKDNMDTKSRALEYLSTSTFALIIDDAGKLDDSIQSEIKNYTTMEANYERKDKDGGLKSDSPLSNPVAFTWNSKTKMFDLIEILTRSLFINITTKPTISESTIFTAVQNTIPSGAVGQYIYNITIDLKGADLYEMFKDMKDDSNIVQSRHQIIYKYLQMGKRFAKEWFNLDLDISEAPKLLNETMLLGNEELFNVIQSQIKVGSDPTNFRLRTTESKITYTDWMPLEKWISHPIVTHIYKGENGYIFDSSNKIDLFNRIKMDSSLGLDYLHTILKVRWPTVKYVQINHNNENARRIFIPKSCLNTISEPPMNIDDILNASITTEKITEQR